MSATHVDPATVADERPVREEHIMSARLSSERGAILIHVAVASIVLIAFTMFVVDYGVMWVSRNQAQNAADSGALAGAVALAFDDSTNRLDDGPVKQAAQQFALSNAVFGEAPDVQVDTDVIFYPDDPTKFPDECADDTCVRVDVYRNQARANPLPIMFGQLVGVPDQGVRATATAQALAGNAAQCVKPWVIADRWDEDDDLLNESSWDQSKPFNLATDPDPDPDDGVPDYYEPPSFDSETDVFISGTGFGRTDGGGALVDYGYQFILRMANPGGGSELGVRSPGWVMTVDLPNASVGTEGLPTVLDNIANCHDGIVAVADEDNPCEEPSSEDPADYPDGIVAMTCLSVEPGNAWGPQETALEDWIGPDDINDYWDSSLNGGFGGPSNASSRRIVPLALFNPQHYASHGWTGANGVVKIVNILGFFIQGTCGGGTPIDGPGFAHEGYLACSSSGPANDLVGRLVTIPGEFAGGVGEVGPASFTQVIRLIR
jgi:Flp pilus assembly protein TadG